MRLLLAGAGLLVLAAIALFVLGLARGSDGLLWSAVIGSVLAGAVLLTGGRLAARRG